MMKILYFKAAWCGPCKMMTPVVESVCQSMGYELTVVDVDAIENAELCKQHAIRSVPSTVVLNGESVLTKFIGSTTESNLKESLISLLIEADTDKEKEE